MVKRPQLTIGFPVYNDAATLGPIVRRLMAVARSCTPHWELVAIDDASSDDSLAQLRGLARSDKRLRVCHHARNLGTAKSVRELYRRARGTVVVYFSVDGEWHPEDVTRLWAAVQHADIAVGRRTKKQYRWGRQLVSWLFNMLVQLCFGVRPYDAGSIKAIRRRVLDNVPVISRGVFDEAERIIRASRMGYRVTAVPVHHDRRVKNQRLFPRLSLVWQAGMDLVRVWWDLHQSQDGDESHHQKQRVKTV